MNTPATTASTEPIREAYADLVARTIEANAPYGVAVVSTDYRWSSLETLVDGEWHPVPLASLTWDNGNTVPLDAMPENIAAIRLARQAVA